MAPFAVHVISRFSIWAPWFNTFDFTSHMKCGAAIIAYNPRTILVQMSKPYKKHVCACTADLDVQFSNRIYHIDLELHCISKHIFK